MAHAHKTPIPPTAPLAAGAVVADRYRIVQEIGRGGMGYVFEAEHIALQRRFALKVLRVAHWDDELVLRFEREARALGKVSSPRVAQVTDFGVADGIGPYYVMELVPGQSLQERLDESPMTPREAVETAICLCDALVDVHSQGIVHRDLKPANIGLPGGAIPVKLLDFGLAASIDDAFFTRITQSQQVLGSMPYISPEQFGGARPSVPQDVWAIGVVFYEMLTGSLPFEAPSTPALMHRILTAPPTLRGEVPTILSQVLDKLLHKDPDQRVETAAEAARLLRVIDLDALPLQLDCSGSRKIGAADTSQGSGVRAVNKAQEPPAGRSSFKIAAAIVVASMLVAIGVAWFVDSRARTTAEIGSAADSTDVVSVTEQHEVLDEPVANEPVTNESVDEPTPDPAEHSTPLATVNAGAENDVAETPNPSRRRVEPERRRPARRPPIRTSTAHAPTRPELGRPELGRPELGRPELGMEISTREAGGTEPPSMATNMPRDVAMAAWNGEIIE